MMSDSRSARAALRLTASLALASLALVGCSGKSGTVEEENGPLTEYLLAIDDTADFTQDDYDRQYAETEELVAECMQEQGFEYTPDTQSGTVVFSSDDDTGPEWGSEDFAKEYGYGISTDPWNTGSDEEEDAEEWVDPNGDYVNSLSESEQAAYYEALYGPEPTDEELAAMEEEYYVYDWTKSGCYGKAQHEVEQDQSSILAAYEDPEFTDLFAEMDTVWMAAYDTENPSDELAAINREWTDCMAAAGYPDYASSDEANMALSDEYSELMGWNEESDETQQEPSKKEQQAFTEREIEVAVADNSCQAKVNYQDKVSDLQIALEQEFVDEHKAELDALVAKYGTKKS